MGGSAFAPTLYTPRMPPEVYRCVRDEIHRKLRSHYRDVSTPIEAPGKADYGDVDVLVCEAVPSEDRTGGLDTQTEQQLVALLDAKACKRDKGSLEMHFALRWPEDLDVMSSKSTKLDLSQDLEETKLEKAADFEDPRPRFIQLDLHICPTPEVYAWHGFRCAHGDFWTIVGSVIRRYGLSFRDSGLFARIAEVERVNKKLALVKLSHDPAAVLRFLFIEGSEARFWKDDAFASVQEMCSFIRAHCRFYHPLKEREKEILEHAGEDAETPMQKNGRSTLVKRGNFRYWLEEYLPRQSPQDRETDFRGEFGGITRDEVAEMVKERFGVKREYEETQKIVLRQIGIDTLWADIRSIIPPPEQTIEGTQKSENPALEVNFVLRTLRRKVSKEALERKDEELDEARRAYRDGRFEEVKNWAERNWKEVSERKMAENREKSRVHYKAKMESMERERAEAEA